MNSTNTAAVTISVMVAAVDSAPLVSFAWLFCSAWIAALPALSICSTLQMQRAFDQPLLGGVDAAADLLDQIGQTDDELADDERQDAAQYREAGQQHQRHRAAARQAPRSSQSTTGTSNALSINASSTGTTMISSLATTRNRATRRPG